MQLMQENMLVVILAIALLMTLVMLLRAKKPLTVRNSLEVFEKNVPVAQELAKVAEIAVQSAEQYKLTGKINSNDEALNYAIDFVKKWSPLTASLENAKIIAAIESAVLVANNLSKSLSQKEKPDEPSAIP